MHLWRLAGACLTYIIPYQGELREVLLEALGQIGGGAIISLFVGPGVARDHDLIRHTRARGRNLQAENRVGIERRLIQFNTNGSAYHRAGVVNVNAMTNAVRATRPAGVDQVTAHIMLLNALAQQIRILART